MHIGPSLPFSEQVHAEKYRGPKESFKEACNRIAGTLSNDQEHFQSFRDALLNMRFLPAGRVQSAIGSTKNVTAYNCFVSGTIEDSFVQGHGSIMDIAKEAATTMRMGGGIGYDFSTLRPKGDTIMKLLSQSSGPVSFMSIFDAICRCIASSGHRRGAQMGVLRIDHPDIEEFIHAKQPPRAAEPILDVLSQHEVGTDEWLRWYQTLQAVYRLTGFNVSIAVTDQFMHCLANNKPFPLQFGGKVYREVDPQALWDLVMRSTWDWAEPGVLFIDTINRMNNLYYCETIAATNPCGEQPLPPYGACLLGSFNLVAYIQTRSDGSRYFAWEQFGADIASAVQAMDNVIDRTTYPLYEQEKEAKSKRRMGLGVTGLANALEALGHLYGTPSFVELEATILDFLKQICYQTSAKVAEKKGAFPMYSEKEYLNSEFIKDRIDEDTREMIKRYGIRNSHLTSIAPTGTISMCADNISSGIEPVFSYRQRRIVNMPTGQVETDFDDYGIRVFKTEGKRCVDVTVDEHLNVLATAAQRVDSAVSKTCNVAPSMPWSDFKSLYVRAWEMGCKGITTFQSGGKRAGILKSADEEEPKEEIVDLEDDVHHEPQSACRIDPATGRRECE